MLKRTFTLLAIVLLFVAASAQTVTLTFTGRDANSQRVQLDSVVINNQTKGWGETLVWPDTILTMQNGTGIDETVINDGFGLSQNNPNPFNGTTAVKLMVADAGAVTLEIADVYGRMVETWCTASLQPGINQFRVTLSATGTYILTARQNGKTSSVKMVCNGTGDGNRIEYAGIVETMCTSSLPISATPKKHTRGLTGNPFDLGDEMEYVGFATINGGVTESQHVTQAQNASETIVLMFDSVRTDGLPCPGTPTVTDIDGNVYNTVMIGTQCWMKENLRTMHYTDSTLIPAGETYSETDPYHYAPNNDEANVVIYGYLYNWPAVMHGAATSETNPSGVQGICPTGWHVPGDAEWTQLTDYVSSKSQYVCGSDNGNIAKALASTTGWYEYDYECAVGNDQSVNNATGFSALPAGYYLDGSCSYFGGYGYAGFWSATTNSESNAYDRSFGYGNADVLRDYDSLSTGLSVRCVRD